MKELELKKDYIDRDGLIVIDRFGNYGNRGFDGNNYEYGLFCLNPSEWREATESEVIEAFKKHLVARYGEDWETMKIKKKHPDSPLGINDSWNVDISKLNNGWVVWNKHDLLYWNGVWVERLEEEPKIHIKEAIKKNTIIHCETEEEANRILGMAHELGYKWCTGRPYKGNTMWESERSKTCYNLLDGTYCSYKYFKDGNYNIIPSTQIADFEEKKTTDWSFSPETIKELKASEKADNRYVLKRDVLTILSVESKLNPDKKLSEYLEQFKLILEVL